MDLSFSFPTLRAPLGRSGVPAVVAGTFCLLAVSAQAAVLSDATYGNRFSGTPVNQRFLPSGASIVSTPDSKSCVVSRRIEIESSTYLRNDRSAVPFDDIVRSPATSIQAIAAADGAVSFRIQLKYSVVPGTPVSMVIGDARYDLQDTLERSTDSLWIQGTRAAALEAAFRDGLTMGLSARSVDTDHMVSDTVLTPDLDALAGCVAELPDDTLPVEDISNDVRLVFHADPETTPLATLPQLQACRMNDVPGELHLAKLQQVGGFFSQTDQVFVSFDPDGQLARAYVPGIFDGDFSNNGHTARLSRAADANVPNAANDVKGCLGSAEIEICALSAEDGNHVLAPCSYMQMLSMSDPEGSDLNDPVLSTSGETSAPETLMVMGTTASYGGTSSQFDNSSSTSSGSTSPSYNYYSASGGDDQDSDDDDTGSDYAFTAPLDDTNTRRSEESVSPVPLPASMMFIILGLVSLLATRIRSGKRSAR
ncbi:hypothetical protein KO516_19305 [Citreicella sp. C3M06]|uniref:hypothetical protein n=1 Tax=Citreicella sp. C3M06 TaxID=2841564 RepID=UPI001C08A644|nr:hypothetical protein [Citreicella sp. C3M06]MBU2962936.1 hypothetical protein [Citreicella sp. C3M06]